MTVVTVFTTTVSPPCWQMTSSLHTLDSHLQLQIDSTRLECQDPKRNLTAFHVHFFQTRIERLP